VGIRSTIEVQTTQTGGKAMKTKLLRRLRSIGRDQVTVYSITKTNGYITGMQYGHPGEGYRDLFDMGTTEEELKEKACRIYLNQNIESIRKRYKKKAVKP